MSFIPLIYRKNKLVSIGIRSSSLEYDSYSLTLNLESGKEYTALHETKTYVSNLLSLLLY